MNGTLIESMTKLQFPEYTVRVWREEANADTLKNSRNEVIVLVKGLFGHIGDNFGSVADKDCYQVAKRILRLDNVNAVEVVDDAGAGVVLYKNWP